MWGGGQEMLFSWGGGGNYKKNGRICAFSELKSNGFQGNDLERRYLPVYELSKPSRCLRYPRA